jgi:ribosomal protein L39E
MVRRKTQKKIKLGKHARRTKWAPFWAVLRKHGVKKRVHPSAMTRIRRNWRVNKLKIKPRRIQKRHLG